MAELFGMHVEDLPEGAMALECVVLVKALDGAGELILCERKSPGLTTWEALGMAITFADTARDRLRTSYGEE